MKSECYGASPPLPLILGCVPIAAGIDAVHMPYKGGAPAEADLAGGQGPVHDRHGQLGWGRHEGMRQPS